MASSSSLVSLWPGCTVRTVPSVHEVFHFLTSIAVRARRQCSTQALPVVGCFLMLKMSDSQEGRTILNAHARDWGDAETVRRRCLGAVGGFALRVECTDPGACG